MRLSFKDGKFILVLIIGIILLVILAVIEGYLKEEVLVDYTEEKKVHEVIDTVQDTVVYNYVRVGNWETAFKKINNRDKAYDLKDKVEEKIGTLTTYKKWNIVDALESQDGYIVINLTSEISRDYISVIYDEVNNEIKSFKLNDKEVK